MTEQGIVYGCVLVPGLADCDRTRGEKLLTEKEIQRIAHKWMSDYRNIDIRHTLKNVAVPVESYLLPAPMQVTLEGRQVTLPKGSWILASKVEDAAVLAEIKAGVLKGYSVMGIASSKCPLLKRSGV
ncbi:MAG: XkdF-like putative serine protease domain-containing protein [Methanomicrobiales archaeon]